MKRILIFAAMALLGFGEATIYSGPYGALSVSGALAAGMLMLSYVTPRLRLPYDGALTAQVRVGCSEGAGLHMAAGVDIAFGSRFALSVSVMMSFKDFGDGALLVRSSGRIAF